jgi:hypothetical protein
MDGNEHKLAGYEMQLVFLDHNLRSCKAGSCGRFAQELPRFILMFSGYGNNLVAIGQRESLMIYKP